MLEQYLFDKEDTPIGQIYKIEVHRKIYRLEVWGADTTGPPLCALQLYQLPPSSTVEASPARSVSVTPSSSQPSRIFPYHDSMHTLAGTPVDTSLIYSHSSASSYQGSSGGHNYNNQPPTLFLAEFIRGQLDIFAFKRFYQWTRQRLSEVRVRICYYMLYIIIHIVYTSVYVCIFMLCMYTLTHYTYS